MYQKEKQMYPEVCAWLNKLLREKFRNAVIHVEDTSEKILSKWLLSKNYHKYFEDYQTYDIQVDITGLVIFNKNKSELIFVECKLNKITLRDLSQLLGYSKVARPILSIIISPAGISHSVDLLFNVFRRNDILYYTENRHILIIKWNENRKNIEISSIIPKGAGL